MKPAAHALLIGVVLCVVLGVIVGIVGARSDTLSTAVAAGTWSNFLILLAGVGVVGLLVIRAITQDLDERIPAKPKRSEGLGVVWGQDQATE
jgi:hypothetical protein